jgi:hypothetical protein
MALCPQCRNALPETPPRYCPNCGADLEAAAAPAPGSAGDVPPGAPAPPPPLPPGGTWTPSPPPPGGGGPGGSGPPWEERDRLGILAALVETTKKVMAEPTAFFRAMPTHGGIGSPLLYAVLVGWIGIIASGFYSALFQSIVGTSMLPFARNREFTEALGFAQSWVGFLVQSLFAPVGIVIGVFVAAGIFHLMLLVLGGARRDFEATFRAVSYGQAPYVLLIVPFCGSVIAWVWSLVLYVIGIAEAQQVSRGKAAAAVLLPLVLVCCCCAGVLFLIWGSVAAMLAGARQ